MADYYYSTQPFLAWCFNHYFYSQRHFSWAAAPFYPYKLSNPTSSNPFRIYQELYEPWKDADKFSKYVAQTRLSVRAGVEANRHSLGQSLESRLKQICNNIDLVFFYPIVYRIDIEALPATRLRIAGSGLVGSNEFLIDDLGEHEFDVLFFDISSESSIDPDIRVLWDNTLSSNDVLDVLEAHPQT